MNNPIPVFTALEKILAPLVYSQPDATVVYPAIQEKLRELREWRVDEGLLHLIDDSAQVMLRMRPGNECGAAAQVMSAIYQWKRDNPIWLKDK